MLSGALGALPARFGAAPPEYCVDARHQLPRVERLRQVIVRAQLEPYDAVDVVAPRRQQDHRNRRNPPQPPQHFKPVHSREHHVEHHENVFPRFRPFQPRRAVRRGLRGKALVLQKLPDQFAQFVVVVDDENVVHLSSFLAHLQGRPRKDV